MRKLVFDFGLDFAVDSDHQNRSELLGKQEHPGRVLCSSCAAKPGQRQQTGSRELA